MVITVYADRRATAVGDISTHLASALALRTAPATVALLTAGDDATGRDGIAVEEIRANEHPDVVTARLGALGARHAAVVAATTGPLSETILAVCDAADVMIVVSDPSVPSLRATQRTLKRCRSLGYATRLALVLHGFADDAPLSVIDAATVLRREIYWQLPDRHAAAAERAASFAGLAEKLLRLAPR